MDKLTEKLARVLEAMQDTYGYDRMPPGVKLDAAAALKAYHDAQAAEQERLASTVVGICPACGKEVYANEPDGPGWTCPRDLSPSNRFWEPSAVPEAEKVREGIYSNCPDDFGRYCGAEHMPLHSACYDKGNY